MAFTSPAFDPAKPAGTDLVSDVDTFIKDFKTQVLERQRLEHYSYIETGTNAGSATDTAATAHGRHIPGKCGVVYCGDTAAIAAVVLAGDIRAGCLFFDTTDSVLKVYNGSALVLAAPSVTANVAGQNSFKVRQTSLSLGSPAVSDTRITFNTLDFGDATNIIVGTGGTQSRYIAKTAGRYQFNYSISLTAPAHTDSDTAITMTLKKSGTIIDTVMGTLWDGNTSNVSGSFLSEATLDQYFEIFITTACTHAKTLTATFSGFRVY